MLVWKRANHEILSLPGTLKGQKTKQDKKRQRQTKETESLAVMQIVMLGWAGAAEVT